MAKKLKHPPPAEITLALNTPGMTAMHRAGLGGLACTLGALEAEVRRRSSDPAAEPLPEWMLPGHPWGGGQPPWLIEEHRLTLRWGTDPAGFLKRLFTYAFQITPEGLIWLPGWTAGSMPRPEVLAALQDGLLFSFLQHGKSRSIAKDAVVHTYDVGAEVPAKVRFRPCKSYQHQSAWEKLTKSGRDGFFPSIEIAGPLCPGSAVRHVGLGKATGAEGQIGTVLPLLFAPVGCLAMSCGHHGGVLLVPDVGDLRHFARWRAAMTPRSAQDCMVAGATDAALQAEVRLRAIEKLDVADLPACQAISFGTLPWSSQQKSRTSSFSVTPAALAGLDRYQVALAHLAPRIAVSQGKAGRDARPAEAFWTDSIVRPLVADNLVLGRPWYAGFSRLMTAYDGRKPPRPLRNLLRFERTQLHAMTKQMTPEYRGETILIEAVHAALRSRYGQIASENEGNPVAMKKRFEGEYERLRLAFSGAKTADVFRNSLCDLFARARGLEPLRSQWAEILPMLAADRWQLARDLSLLALASYQGRGTQDLQSEANEPETEESNEEPKP